ncbi:MULTISPECIES: pyroglutamyl-peptidase I [Caldimonas]|uniref:pyroglutamyl-peptidase I n=1 Tax=Caldimonas TaxID=196013 RepID=UPI00037AE25E|nr:pyroglutamyl-peptidase I [Caldimonas manganoxidans]
MNILLTGFEPFDGDALNPSQALAQALHGQSVDGAPITGVVLPCVFGEALDRLHHALEQHRPDLVLALGQAGGRADLSLERVAINIDDARIPDNAGRQPIDTPVVPGGPAAYFSTLPIKAIVAELRAAGLPASVSQTAGTFVCNHVFYGLMHALATRHPDARGGFMHVPLLPEQAARQSPPAASMALETMRQGVLVALQTALHERVDRTLGAGALN